MKKFYLSLLSMSLLISSVFACDDSSKIASLVMQDSSLVGMVKKAVQSTAERVSVLVNSAVSTARTKSDIFVAAAKVQKDALVIKAHEQKESIARNIKNIAADAIAKAQVYGTFIYYKPEIAAEIVKQFVLKHKKEVGITVAAGLALYTLLRNVGPLAPSYSKKNSKKSKSMSVVITDGILKTALKKGTAAALTAAASVFALNKFVTIKE